MKKAVVLLLAIVLTFGMFACGKSANQPSEPVRVAALAGPTGMGLAYLMQDMSDQYQVEILTAPDQVTAKFINGEVDIAAVPINLASVLYAKTEGAANVIAINTLGVLYLLENGDSVNSIADLAGKTVFSVGQGSTPEYILQYLLAANNLTDSVNVEFIADNAKHILSRIRIRSMHF